MQANSSSRDDKLRKILDHVDSYDKVTYYTPDKSKSQNKVNYSISLIFNRFKQIELVDKKWGEDKGNLKALELNEINY